ncbi:MAG: hypothetical protein PUG16_03410 [Lachnospiraceae bacterium]|jgi:hypothetical protein|nr:hypothetical protein [Lachnospiraceae bacterium]
MENAEIYKEYKETMEALTACLKSLRSYEDQMVLAASDDDSEKLEDLVNKTQPDLLRFRGLDAERDRLEKALGIAGLPFSELLEKPELNEETRAGLAPILENLSRELMLFQESRENADRIMKVRLLNVNQILENQPLPKPFHETRA